MKDNKDLAVCLLVTDFDAPTGGVQKNSRLLLSEFTKRGIESFVCTRNYNHFPRNESKNLTHFHRSPVFGRSMALNSIIYMIDSLFWLLINRRKYDVIHCQQMFGPTMTAAVLSYVIKKPILTRITLSGETGEAKAVLSLPFSSLRIRLLRRISKWVALTNEMKKELKELGIPEEKIKVINNATEIPAEAAYEAGVRGKYRKQLDLKCNKIAVFTGRLSREKRLDVLIKAWKRVTENHPDAHLFLLGDGGNFRNVELELKQYTSSLDLETNVHFVGFVSNPKEYLLASDIFVLPSDAEGMSNSLVEAFGCGTAVIASDIEANKEICVHKVNSLLVEVGNVEKWADAIIELLEHTSLAEEISQKARKLAEDRLSVDKMVSSYLEAYNEICTSGTL